MGSQGVAVWAKILYVEPTGLLGTTSEVVGRLGSTGRSRVRSPRCNPVYLSAVEVPTEATWPRGWLGPQRGGVLSEGNLSLQGEGSGRTA